MGVGKFNIWGSDYVGAFAAATEKNVFLSIGTPPRIVERFREALEVEPVILSVSDTALIGIFMRANSHGIVLANAIGDYELSELKKQNLDYNICVLQSNLNAVGNNILANDKIAIINPDYDKMAEKTIADALSVEVVKGSVGDFKTTGATNILTNHGMVINNRATDQEKEDIDKVTGFNSVRSTAGKGSLSAGLGVIANSKGIVAGEETTGYELTRIIEALGLNG
jgi:translation initiation factor 6